MVGASYLFQDFLTDVQSTEVFTTPMCSYDTIITSSQRTPKLATASSLDTQPNHWDHRAYATFGVYMNPATAVPHICNTQRSLRVDPSIYTCVLVMMREKWRGNKTCRMLASSRVVTCLISIHVHAVHGAQLSYRQGFGCTDKRGETKAYWLHVQQ